MKRRDIFALALAAPTLARPGAVRAQGASWPTRPIRVIVPWPAGSSFADPVARHLGERLAPSLGQPLVIESRAGAAGTIGSELVAKAPPDGHILGVSNIASHAIAPAMYRTLGYDPLRDCTHIAPLGETPLALAVAVDAPHRDLAGLLAAARAQPGNLRIGTPGNGTVAHVTVEALRQVTRLDITQVPFRGSPPAVLEVLAGRIEAAIAPATEFANSDRLRILGLAEPRRLPRYPGIPTFREQGLDLVARPWFGVFGPAALPPTIADRLHREVVAALSAPEGAALLERLGAAPYQALSRADYSAFVAAEATRWGDVVRTAGIRAD
jgi:tripartite-type tricarboxylate transporter receptor subunit TctC